MRITPYRNSSVNFSAMYKTEDVFRLLTGYPYKNKATDRSLINSLTGVDIYSDEFISSLNEDPVYLYSVLSAEIECQDEILRQHPEFKEVYDSFDCSLHLKKGKKEQDNWFKTMLSRFKKEVDIKPFELDQDKLKNNYKEIEKVLEQI